VLCYVFQGLIYPQRHELALGCSLAQRSEAQRELLIWRCCSQSPPRVSRL
jgi:hypothetical protein